MLLLDPKGPIAADEKSILITATYFMLAVVIPVIVLTLYFAWHYRASNTKAVYRPEWAHSTMIEVVCWSIPLFIIAVLADITWTSSHKLDPYRPIKVGATEAEVIQVVSLDWKWLFIYPKEKIATINYLQLPVNTPVKFVITSEAAMNSFIIPQLAGQIYAMAGMQATLYTVANTTGNYPGFSANYSGNGFSDMHFIAHVSSKPEFAQWVESVKHQATPALTMEKYQQLTKPTIANAPTYFSSADPEIFEMVVMQNMMPMHDQPTSTTTKS